MVNDKKNMDGFMENYVGNNSAFDVAKRSLDSVFEGDVNSDFISLDSIAKESYARNHIGSSEVSERPIFNLNKSYSKWEIMDALKTSATRDNYLFENIADSAKEQGFLSAASVLYEKEADASLETLKFSLDHGPIFEGMVPLTHSSVKRLYSKAADLAYQAGNESSAKRLEKLYSKY